MTQSIILQVGQCGNQIASRFWDLAVREHSANNETASNDSAISTFFLGGVAEGNSYLSSSSGLKARAVLVDMEEGVVNGLLKGPLRHLYDNRYLITDVSGSGNNWAVGMYSYGNRYHEELLDAVRKSAELCDCLQCFFLIHSLGGGTGSGIGTRLLKIVTDEYPNVYRFAISVFPSMDDDVITSPYNTVLGLKQLTDLADCVLPIDNSALASMVRKLEHPSAHGASKAIASAQLPATIPGATLGAKSKAFDEMNNIVASMMLNLTSSSRFEGTMNVDLNEISMNLVPFPRLHYVIAAQNPLSCVHRTSAPRKIDESFQDVFTRDFQLISADPARHSYLAAALLLRGSITHSELRKNIAKLQQRLRFVPWNREGWKVGHCLVPPVGFSHSVLALANNTAMRDRFSEILNRFSKLYRRKAHLHHYVNVDGFDAGLFDASTHSLTELCVEYDRLDQQAQTGKNPQLPRLQISS